MAIVGTQLLTPELGWQRYSCDNINIKYNGSGWGYAYSIASYGGGFKYVINYVSQTITFKFKGTKLRIMSLTSSARNSLDYISIDGVEESYTERITSDIVSCLLYEKIGLLDTIHTVSIRSAGTSYFTLSSIDIDSTGYLVHPILGTLPKLADDNIQIGDYITCEYIALTSGVVGTFVNLGSATKSEIPFTGTATPNGSFNFICVDKDYLGRKKFIADRNIQHSISWDKLNTAGIASGKNINQQDLKIQIAPMTTYIKNNITISASTDRPSYPAWKVFDGNVGTDTSRWVTADTIVTGWLKIDFGDTPKLLIKYTLNCLTYPTGSPKNWTFEGSNDNINWTILDSRSNILISTTQGFDFVNNISYRYYRINITANNGHTGYTAINEIEVFENISLNSDSLKYYIRFLTGGISAANKDNEWDKYIAESTLGGLITAGDNAVWNWNGLYSWMSTSNGNFKVLRGNTSVLFHTWGSTTELNGFRPVLIVESLDIIVIFEGQAYCFVV